MNQKDEMKFVWNFYRIGGLDQVALRTAEELCHLDQLDPKLWVALSCPASGLEFDEKTLALIDTDHDGRIRIPEVTAAVKWICERLVDPADLVEPAEALPLSRIRPDTEDGRRLLASARAVLASRGRPEAEAVTVEEVAETAAEAALNILNGDGVLPPLEGLEGDIRQYIEDALSVIGGVEDVSGQPGINLEISRAFMTTLTDWRAWRQRVDQADSPLGADTAEVWELVEDLAEKIDDYFLRSELASFAPGTKDILNSNEKLAAVTEGGLLSRETLSGLPLSHVEANRPLMLSQGVNPAWRKPLERLFNLTKSLRKNHDLMTQADWTAIKKSLSAYSSALAGKPKPAGVTVAYPPTSAVDQVSLERIGDILDSGVAGRFEDFIARDADAPATAGELAALERLVRYYRHLHQLLMNFVSFHDFYAERGRAIFQAGQLYIDGRMSCLCLPVTDVEKHAVLAGRSNLCLLYCLCARRGRPGDQEAEGSRTVVAAMTAGDADSLMEGRNAVFVDNQGHDWDATVVKLVPNTISMREAIWEPYKKVGHLIGEQVDKFAGARQEKFINAASGQAAAAGTVPADPAAKAATPFDIGKSVGIFAAIGLALGAIGTAVAALARAFFALTWWQVPLVFLGLFLIISGPSVILGWLKLRRRAAGPLLEASGWAVNSRIPIGLALGGRLTDRAVLPDNSIRNHNDPLEKPRRWPVFVLIGVLLILGAAAGWLWFQPNEEPHPAASAVTAAPAQTEQIPSAPTTNEPELSK